MTQQEQAWHDFWDTLRLEQKKEELRREYIDRIAAKLTPEEARDIVRSLQDVMLAEEKVDEIHSKL